MRDNWDQVKRCRMRAAELRAVADQFAVPTARDKLMRLAESYEAMADQMEKRLSHPPEPEPSEAG